MSSSSSSFWQSSGDDDEEYYLSQPFYPSKEPSLLDFLRPLPCDVNLSYNVVSASPPNEEMRSLSLKRRIAAASGNGFDLRDMQRSKSLDQRPLLVESDKRLLFGNILRRACSTGDLRRAVGMVAAVTAENNGNKNPLSGGCNINMTRSPLSMVEGGYLDENGFIVGRYTPEERKERIERYKIKRSKRNYGKTIKYACRKSLAENRPRIRGRFAKIEDNGEDLKASTNRREGD